MSVLSMMLAFLMVPAAKSSRDDRVLELEQENKSLKMQITALQGGHAADQITIATYREIARQRERSIEAQRGLAQYWQNTARSLMREPDPIPRLRERMELFQQQMLMEQYQQALHPLAQSQHNPLAQWQQNEQALGQQGHFTDCTCIPDRATALGIPMRAPSEALLTLTLGSVEERASRGALTGDDWARMGQARMPQSIYSVNPIRNEDRVIGDVRV